MKSVVSEKGQVTIPKPVRSALGLRPGTVVEFSAKEGLLVGTKISAEDVVSKWRGRGALPKKMSVEAYLALTRGKRENRR